MKYNIMNFIRFNKEIYKTFLPLMTVYPTVIGIDTASTINRRTRDNNSTNEYTNFIGYTSIGIITGLTYPLFGCYVLYKNMI